MQWMLEYSELISTLTGVGTLLVWVIYLQVFVSNYRRQLRATLLITRGAGYGLDASCFLSNMSSGPVFVQSVLITLETADETLVCPATDIQEKDGEAPSDARLRTRQGPIGSGEIRDIGSFSRLMRRALRGRVGSRNTDILERKVRAMIVEIVGVYGSEDLPIGARRRFVLVEDAETIRIEGEYLQTQQIRRKQERKRLISDLKRDR